MRKFMTLSILVFAAACDDDAARRPPPTSDPVIRTAEDTAAELSLDLADDAVVTMGEPRHGRLTGAGAHWIYTPDPDFHGTDTAPIMIGTARAADAHVAITVTPVNDPPMARPDLFAARQDIALRLTTAALLANDVDVDSALTVVAVLPGREGSVTMEDGFVVFTPPAGWSGATGFTYAVSDGEATAHGAVTIDVGASDQPPIAGADLIETDEDTYVHVASAALLANDADPNGHDLILTAVGGATGGTVELAGDGVVFTPDVDFHGHGRFQYTISDGAEQATGEVEVAIASVNDVPLAADDTGAGDEDAPVVIVPADLLANDGDVDGDSISLTAVGDAHGGRVVLAIPLIVFTPDPDFHGTAGFSYTISDGAVVSKGHVALAIAPVNDAPVALDDGAATSEDLGIEIAIATLLNNDADADADALTLIAVGDAVGGTVTRTGGQTLSFKPDADFTGGASFHYTITDGFAEASATVSIAVQPVNDAPVARLDQAQTDEDVALMLPADDLIANDLDVDGDALAVTAIVEAIGGTAVLAGTQITFTPDPDFHGDAAVAYEISDGQASASAIVAIAVASVNDAPIASPAALVTDEDVALPIGFAATDADGDAITYTVTAGPAHGTLTGSEATWTYAPTANYHGADQITYTAHDGVSASAPVTIDVLIVAVIECGDGEVDGPVVGSIGGTEQCDDGNQLGADGCDASCQLERCGDGAIQYDLGEICDDGNLVGQDGCDAGCQLEGAFVTTEPVLISGALDCAGSSADTGRKIAVDSIGNVYAVLRCGGEAYLAASHDRGATFAAPLAIGITGADEIGVAAAGPGVAYVAATAGGQIMFARTSDGGATWSSPESLGATSDTEISIEAFNDHVFVGASAVGGITVLHSGSRGVGPWASSDVGAPQASAELIYDDRTDTLLACADSPALHVRISTDAGVSFGAEATPAGQAYFSDWATGAGRIFAVGTALGGMGDPELLNIIDAADPTVSWTQGGLPFTAQANQRTVAADVSGNAYVATTLDGGGVQLDRLGFDDASLGQARSITTGGGHPGLTGLPSSTGVAMTYASGSSVYATIQVY